MAILTPSQLQASNASTYTTNGVGSITGASARSFNVDFISSSITVSQTGSMSVASAATASSVSTLNQAVTIVGAGTRLTITGSAAGAATTFSDRTMNAIAYEAPGVDVSSQLFSSDTGIAGQYIGAIKSDFSVDVEHAIIATTNSITLNDWDNNSAVYVPYLSIAPNTGNNPIPSMVRGLQVTSSLTITGSAYGNVIPVTVSSNTASINLAAGNFFTATLGSNATTFFNITNPKPGVTANLILTTGTNSTASFSSNVKQPSGNSYLPTSGSGQIDALSLVAVDSSNVYLVASKKFV